MQIQHTDHFQVRQADWEADQLALRAVRLAVFVREQQVPETIEWDVLDQEAVHLIAESDDGRTIATARLLPSGQIGRMAVLPDLRGRGIGSRLLIELLRFARLQGYPSLFLHAKHNSVEFYRKLGFEAVGEIFEEVGIAHQMMCLNQQKLSPSIEIQTRTLAQHSGRLKLVELPLQQQAVDALASQSNRELRILTPDLEPLLYDRATFLEQVKRLAVERRGHLPVRILLLDAGPALRRGHRLIELSRKLSSAVQMRAIPEEFAERCDHYLLADNTGYVLSRHAVPRTLLLDFNAAATVRRMQREFERIWEQGTVHLGLRRLYL